MEESSKITFLSVTKYGVDALHEAALYHVGVRGLTCCGVERIKGLGVVSRLEQVGQYPLLGLWGRWTATVRDVIPWSPVSVRPNPNLRLGTCRMRH